MDCSPQAPLSMGFSRQEWSGLPCPPPEDLPDPGIEPVSPELQAEFFTIWATSEVQESKFHIFSVGEIHWKYMVGPQAGSKSDMHHVAGSSFAGPLQASSPATHSHSCPLPWGCRLQSPFPNTALSWLLTLAVILERGLIHSNWGQNDGSCLEMLQWWLFPRGLGERQGWKAKDRFSPGGNLPFVAG